MAEAEQQITHEHRALIDELARDYGPALLKFLKRRAMPWQDPEDLAQDVFERLAKRGGLERGGGIEAYIFQTARSVLADTGKKDKVRHRGQHDPYEDFQHGIGELTPEDVLRGKQSVKGLFDALYELPERTRDVFVLYHFKNLRQADIAKLLGIGVSTVELHMSKAMRYLSERVDIGE